MATLADRVNQAYIQGPEAVLALVESEIHTARYSVLSQPGKCRFCGRTPLSPGLHHMMNCKFYEGPLVHHWVRTRWNETFGGVDYDCKCGGWFRQGGLAGHGDGTDSAEAVCPHANQDWRGPRA
jgi:hypothetical protein